MAKVRPPVIESTRPPRGDEPTLDPATVDATVAALQTEFAQTDDFTNEWSAWADNAVADIAAGDK